MSLTLFFVALGLATDAALVTASEATLHRSRAYGIKLVLLMGGAQAALPIVGALVGQQITPLVKWGRYAAAVVFVVLAWKLLQEGDEESRGEPTLKRASLLALATSIDALVVGAAFPGLGFPIYESAAWIGIITAVVVALAFAFGTSIGNRFEKAARYVGALLLTASAVNSVM